MRRRLTRMILTGMILAGAVSPAPAEEIRMSCGGTTAAHVVNPIRDAFEKTTGIKLSAVTIGGKNALLDLDSGAAEVAGAAHTLDELVGLIKKDGKQLNNESLFRAFKVADPVNYAIIVHRDNPLAKLTKDQIKGIFTGKIANWKDVGGPDREILVVIPKLQIAGNDTLSKKMLDKDLITRDVIEVNVYADVKRNVAALPEAIGMIMAIEVDPTVKAVESPQITTGPIVFMTIGEPTAKVRALIDFATGEGKQHIKN